MLSRKCTGNTNYTKINTIMIITIIIIIITIKRRLSLVRDFAEKLVLKFIFITTKFILNEPI